MSGNAGSI